jgi:SAM-dependent methyltransferase
MIFFTICSRNFLAYSNTLWSSLAKIYPESAFYAALCDEHGDFDEPSIPYPIIDMQALGISRLEDMKYHYNITELNTSIKPFVFSYLFDRHPGEVVVYLDPDIIAFNRFTELETLVQEGANCVLTPHIVGPAEHAEMSDLKFLIYGIYNLGFCTLRDTAEVRRVVSWWGRRLEEYCVIDKENGLFVDQKWADYLPAFIAGTRILRHPGYNVAYWNLSERRLRCTGGNWTVNGSPLRFFHFSGNRIEDTQIYTRHSKQFTVENTPVLGELLRFYRNEVFRNGHQFYSDVPYAYSWGGRLGMNEHTPESMQRAKSSAEKPPHLPVLRSRTMEDFFKAREHNAEMIRERRSIEISSIPGNGPFTIEGFCHVCGQSHLMQVSQMYSSQCTPDGLIIPNWREHLNCLNCGMVNRVRGALKVLDQEFPVGPDSRVYITEQVTQLFALLQKRFTSIVGSEYLSLDVDGGSNQEGIRHEDVQALSFRDASFDLVLSFDVLEHVPFPQRAFKELFRVLAPGGRLLFTVPFSYRSSSEVTRAIVSDAGEIEHLMEPEYHGNPVDMDGGSLCFRYFGWSLVDSLKQAGFVEVEVLSYWSQALMHFGDPQFVITAQRPHELVPHNGPA